jgi:hypothetical protein
MLTQAHANELFRYEDGKLLRRIQRGSREVDKPVGSPCTDGRLQVKIATKMYYVHRLIYLMHHGEVPEFVDHADGDHTNNRIENLRPASRAENNRNAKLRKDNKYGVKGVALHKGRWIARLRVDGKAVHVGSYGSMEAAAAAVSEARERLHGPFHRHQ